MKRHASESTEIPNLYIEIQIDIEHFNNSIFSLIYEKLKFEMENFSKE